MHIRSASNTNEVNWDDPLNKGLVSWYPMKQKGGDLIDIAGGHNASLGDGLYWEPDGSPTGNGVKRINSPADFDNSAVVDVDSIDFTSMTGLTIFVWARSIDSTSYFPAGLLSGASDWTYIRPSGASVRFRATDGTNDTSYYMPFGWSDDEWHCYALSLDGSTLRSFADGKTNSTSATFDFSVVDGQFRIGGINTVKRGDWSDIRIYNRALSLGEIQELYDASRTGYKNQYKRRYFPVSLQTEEPLTLLEKIRSVAKPTTTRALSVKKNSVPSYKAGYAKSASESANPKLMEGLRLAWVPSAFYSGISVIRDISPGGSVNGSLINYTSDNVEIIDGKVVYRNQTDRAIRSAKLPFELTSTSDISVIWNGRPFSNYNYLGVLSEGTGDGDVKLGVNSSSQLYNFRFITPGTSSTLAKNTAWLNAREMHQFVQVYDNSAGKWRFYIDGEFESDLSAASNSWDADDTFRLGEGFRNVSGNWRIGDFLVYDRALSDSEVKQLDRDPLAPFRKKTTVGYQPSKELRGLFRT